jgi:hypothetical protein
VTHTVKDNPINLFNEILVSLHQFSIFQHKYSIKLFYSRTVSNKQAKLVEIRRN